MLTIQRLFPKNRLTKIELIKVSNNNPLYSLDGLERDFVKEFYSTVGKFNTTTQFKFNLEKVMFLGKNYWSISFYCQYGTTR